jgi:hypothetical protein
MLRLVCFLLFLVVISPVFAEDVPSNTQPLVTASYVQGAYNAMDATKQDKLSSTNVVETGSGAMVTSITANDGTVQIQKSEVTIPVGATVSDTRATIWLE